MQNVVEIMILSFFPTITSGHVKREVVSLCLYTTWEAQFSCLDQNLFQTPTSINQLGFVMVS